MISAKGVYFSYDEQPVISDISLRIADAESVLLAGLSGSGKSTLLRTFNGLIPHTTGGTFRGDVFVGDTNTRDTQPRNLSARVGFVHQDPDAQSVVGVVDREIAFALENHGTDAMVMRRRVEESLEALGIADLRYRETATLSGGQRQRLAIAVALAMLPETLLLDEPTSQLDPQAAEEVFASVTRLRNELGMNVVIAEHRLDRLLGAVDRAVVLDGGRVIADGEPSIALDSLAISPALSQLARRRNWDFVPVTVGDAKRIHDQISEPTPKQQVVVGEPVLNAQQIAFRYDIAPVLRDVSLQIAQGERVAILGRNGAGKTTLLKIIAGVLRKYHGNCQINGRTGYVPQNPDALLFAPTVRESLIETTQLLGTDTSRLDQITAEFDLAAILDRHPRSLSMGQRQLTSLASIMIGSPSLLLCDEPTRGLDGMHQQTLDALLKQYSQVGGAVMFATHDIEFAARVATRVIVLGEGEVLVDGNAREVLCSSMFAPITSRIFPGYLHPDEVPTVRQ